MDVSCASHKIVEAFESDTLNGTLYYILNQITCVSQEHGNFGGHFIFILPELKPPKSSKGTICELADYIKEVGKKFLPNSNHAVRVFSYTQETEQYLAFFLFECSDYIHNMVTKRKNKIERSFNGFSSSFLGELDRISWLLSYSMGSFEEINNLIRLKWDIYSALEELKATTLANFFLRNYKNKLFDDESGVLEKYDNNPNAEEAFVEYYKDVEVMFDDIILFLKNEGTWTYDFEEETNQYAISFLKKCFEKLMYRMYHPDWE